MFLYAYTYIIVIEVSTRKNSVLEPGKTIEYLQGEILTIQLTQWGILGKIKTEEGVYNYRLKDPELKKKLILGMDLVIENGFCITNKEEEIVATEGKFGKVDTIINLNRYSSLKSKDNSIITGKIKRKIENENNLELVLETLIPHFSDMSCTIKNEHKEFQHIVSRYNEEELIKVSGNLERDVIIAEELVILPQNHFWYRFLNLIQNEPEDILEFAHIISEQIDIIGNYYEMFKDLLLNMGKEISKNTLVELRSIIETKVLGGEQKFPFNLLISKSEIVEYLDKMHNFCRNMLHGTNTFKEPEDILVLIEHYYTNYKIKFKEIK